MDRNKGVDSTKEGQTVYLGSASTCLDHHFPFLALLRCTKKIILITFGTDHVNL